MAPPDRLALLATLGQRVRWVPPARRATLEPRGVSDLPEIPEPQEPPVLPDQQEIPGILVQELRDLPDRPEIPVLFLVLPGET